MTVAFEYPMSRSKPAPVIVLGTLSKIEFLAGKRVRIEFDRAGPVSYHSLPSGMGGADLAALLSRLVDVWTRSFPSRPDSNWSPESLWGLIDRSGCVFSGADSEWTGTASQLAALLRSSGSLLSAREKASIRDGHWLGRHLSATRNFRGHRAAVWTHTSEGNFWRLGPAMPTDQGSAVHGAALLDGAPSGAGSKDEGNEGM
jgi:hypothetical protein